jgi:hypothetical protein
MQRSPEELNAGQLVDRVVHIGIGHDDGVVFSPRPGLAAPTLALAVLWMVRRSVEPKLTA